MNLAAMLLMAVASNLDNIGVGLAYGARNIRIPAWANLLIAAITGAGTFLSMYFGQSLSAFIPLILAKTAGCLLIGGAGILVIWQAVASPGCQPGATTGSSKVWGCNCSGWLTVLADFREFISHSAGAVSGDIGVWEASVLGSALTLNNLSAGFGAGLVGMNTAVTTLLVFCLSLATLSAGQYCGLYYASPRLGDKACLASGALLVFLGLYEYVML